MCVCVCVCVAKPVAVKLRCHATALILVIGKAQFRRAMLSCDSSCFGMPIKTLGSLGKIRVGRVTGNTHIFFFGLSMWPIQLIKIKG